MHPPASVSSPWSFLMCVVKIMVADMEEAVHGAYQYNSLSHVATQFVAHLIKSCGFS